MNRLYLIVPVLLLAVFGGVYWQHTRTADDEARARAAATAQAKTLAEAQKSEAERKAREDAGLRTAARLAAEQKQAEEKRARWEAESARLAEDTSRYAEQVTALRQELSVLEKTLAEIRAQRDQLAKDTFDQARAVELARIARRNAELEVQRMTEMVARKAAQTSLVVEKP